MSSFKFPPPPPPPPKASSNDTKHTYGSQRGGSGRGGGERGRGRGGSQSRGTGMHSSAGNSRGGYNHDHMRGGRGRGGPRGSSQHQRGGGNHRGSQHAGRASSQNWQGPPTNAPPAQAYINPAFVNQSQDQGQAQSQVDPNALAQVMSYMSTPAGVHSMAAFASHMTNGGNTPVQGSPTSPPRIIQVSPRYSPQQQAGQKRKLGDCNKNTQPHTQPTWTQQSTRPPRAKAAVPPPVPSFGFSLPIPSIAPPSAASNTKSKKEQKKRKLNLGLSDTRLPAEEPTSDGEAEEDVDEEAACAQKLKDGGFAFEYQGEQITIRTAAEVAAWVRDRRKNFPTQQRIAEKAQEQARKRATEIEFLRKLKGLPPKTHDETRLNESPTKALQPPKPTDDTREAAKHDKGQEDLAALRKKLHQSMVDKQNKPPPVNLGLGYESDSSLASDAESSIVSSLSPSSEDENEEDDDDEADSDSSSNEPPAPTSSKIPPLPIHIPPPGPKSNPEKLAEQQGKKTCETWLRTGRCKFSNKCRYAHPAADKGGEGRTAGGLGMSLYERMVEQELVKREEMGLRAIKWLGANGVLG
ncbi:hypothetical protein LEMA_P029730.1 [Plenodomus lingam JN3]|uniref:C3H1-type domain-containing protein n=1 Tax=Leptosphaeria maculans (strain JN3 / isolate v23.1.3 / race Av1-4-5-6-7-8) TaxID=985895 RepID=E4ZW45_LEPMJ|nr:hypothetical protein LEMA_P029730.1 [Plenodomus lingam JN3]CBX95821.1 hypothetical protein LEMA_P029730.1 [Plenodomus lingam JN3]